MEDGRRAPYTNVANVVKKRKTVRSGVAKSEPAAKLVARMLATPETMVALIKNAMVSSRYGLGAGAALPALLAAFFTALTGLDLTKVP